MCERERCVWQQGRVQFGTKNILCTQALKTRKVGIKPRSEEFQISCSFLQESDARKETL